MVIAAMQAAPLPLPSKSLTIHASGLRSIHRCTGRVWVLNALWASYGGMTRLARVQYLHAAIAGVCLVGYIFLHHIHFSAEGPCILHAGQAMVPALEL